MVINIKASVRLGSIERDAEKIAAVVAADLREQIDQVLSRRRWNTSVSSLKDGGDKLVGDLVVSMGPS